MPANPCCCRVCVIASDDFTTDKVNTDPIWTIGSGTWTVSSGILSTDDDNALLIAIAAHPDGDYESQVVQSLVRFETNEHKARLIIAYDDSDNYLFVEFWRGTDGCGHIQAYERIGGSNTALGSEFTMPFEVDLDEWHTVRLCYVPGASVEDPGTLYLRVQTSDGNIWVDSVATSADLPGDQGGLGTGSTPSTGIDFDDFSYQYYYDAVDHPTCPECSASDYCVLHSDDFNRSNSSTVGCAWEEVSGDWSISSNELTIAASGAILRNQVQHPEDEATVYFQVVYRAAAGAVIRLILDYEDTSNYFFAELEPGSHGEAGRVKFWRRSSGTNTQVGHDTVIEGLKADETDVAVAICFSEDGIVRFWRMMDNGGGVWQISGDSFSWATREVTQEATTPYVALGTGASASQVWFDDFQLIRLTEDLDEFGCKPCGAPACTGAGEETAWGDLWVAVAGTWDASAETYPNANFGGDVIVTEDSDAIFQNEAGHPGTTVDGDVDLSSAAYVEFYCEGYSSFIRVLIGYEDDENYLFGEVELAADDSSQGFLRVGKVVAGVQTDIDEVTLSVNASQPHEAGLNSEAQALQYSSSLRVCYDGLDIRALFTSGAYANLGLLPQASAEGEAGLDWNPGKSAVATGTITEPVYFGEFTYYFDILGGICQPCHVALQCDFCGENDEADDGACLDRTPPVMLLRLSGIAPASGWVAPAYCADIDRYNDTFALPFFTATGGAGSTACTWLAYPRFCDGATDAQIRIDISQNSGTEILEIVAHIEGYGDGVIGNPTGFADGDWTKEIAYGDIPSEVVFNTSCELDTPTASELGVNCLGYFADWMTIAEGDPMGTFWITGTTWLSDLQLTSLAEFKVMP